MTETEAEARELATGVLSPPSEEWWVRDVASSYPWANSTGMWWIIDGEDQSVIIVRREERTWLLSGPGGVPLIGKLLRGTGPEEPLQRFTPRELAQVLMAWHSDPRTYVLDKVFVEQQEPVLDSWLMGEEQNPDALVALAVEPRLKIISNSWRLLARAIDRHGAVEEWTASGDVHPFTVRSIERALVRPEGTFYFPDEL